MEFRSLPGMTSYREVRELQLELVDLRAQGQIPDTVLFLEHHPVITRGRGLQWTGVDRPKHMPIDPILPESIAFEESERGGDLTYHGPGQLVIYPICKLDGKGFAPERDVAGFLRKLEQLVIDELQFRGLEARVEKNAAGVWIQSKKTASMGVAVKKWVTYHGIAINCVNDLSPFQLISPCGFSPEIMTRLGDWIDLGTDWRADLEDAFSRRMI